MALLFSVFFCSFSVEPVLGTGFRFNGATQRDVGKGRDEQRVPFSNLLDDIGGQLLQSSQQFLLCQLRQPSKECASSKIHHIDLTLDTSQSFNGWLKERAPRNIQPIFFTLDTFQLFSGWLKDFASSE